MPTLSQLLLSRLASLRRIPFWAQAAAVCALFAVAGVAVVDDYGIGLDENAEQRIARTALDYALNYSFGAAEELELRYKYPGEQYYGVAFSLPLLLAERALGLKDSRDIYLMRHMLTHLLFIAGGFACGMLAYRMMGSRWLAMLAMLMFLLHPRLYAHSFFNTKDIPFAVMLIIALYLTHRAFRKDTLGAFLLCGICVGLAINLRGFGLMLLPMILAMRGLDLWQASGEERKRALKTGVALAVAAIATAWIAHPYYWENPLRFIEGLRVLSQFPAIRENLFMGEIYRSDAVPWNYIPAWFGITAPPLTLALGAIGCAAVCRQAIMRPIAALRDRETRFGVLLLGCVALPVAAFIILQSNIYNGWRHMYFLWGPFCLIAAIGLRAIADSDAGQGGWNIAARLPGLVRGGGRRHMARRTLAYGAAGVGLATTLTAMAALHPHQQVYFNALADTKTPGALAKRYDMDYWQVSQRQSLEYLLARYPDNARRVWPRKASELILPQNDRERVTSLDSPYVADFYLWTPLGYHLPAANPHEAGFYHPLISAMNIPERQPIHSVRAYGSAIAIIYGKDAAAYRAAYDDIAANGEPLARADFDIYAYDGALYYLSADCPPPISNRDDFRAFLHITPNDPADLPADRREHGFENRDFWFNEHAAFFDGKCVNRQPLPDYAIARIRTGHNAAAAGYPEWRADVDLAAHAAGQALYEGIAAGDYGKPVARSGFDVYMRDNALAYLKEPCVSGDADARFILHIFPANPADARVRGFANLDFHFADHGAYIGDKCVAARELPDYPIALIRTGQKATSRGGDEWRVDIDLAARAAAQGVHDGIAAGDYGKPVAQSHFDLYLRDNAVTYIKAPCAEGDTDARFLLHIIPADPADLPADARERGFANLDFKFADHGAYAGDICAATIELPDYAIDRIRTGQFVSGEGAIWRAEFPAAR